ncbi:MAG: hypothetical protein R3D70_07280 [Rhizobiaceae bacterium]
MKSKFILAVALALATSATAAFADWKPEKPITIIVPYPPGALRILPCTSLPI